MPRFLADLAQGNAKRMYATAEFVDLQNSPTPLWELADRRRYASMSLQYSRGCPFHCEFCNVTTLFGHHSRVKSTAQVLTELDSLYDFGWRGSVFFVDDNFIGNKQHLKTDLLPALIAWRKIRKGMTFYTETSINLADDERLVEMMVQAGFDTVFIGIETTNEASLAEAHKLHNRNRDLLADVKRLQRAGLQVQGGFIVGFDSDSSDIFQEQIDFIQNSGIATAMVGLLQALPGTTLYERLKREGRLIADASGDNVSMASNILPAMGLVSLTEGYQKILRTIYSPKNYYRRVKTFLKEYPLPKFETSLSLHYKMAFFHASYRLGLFGKERFQFWKIILWTLFTRPKLICEAVTLAIYGYHFRIICKRYIL